MARGEDKLGNNISPLLVAVDVNWVVVLWPWGFSQRNPIGSPRCCTNWSVGRSEGDVHTGRTTDGLFWHCVIVGWSRCCQPRWKHLCILANSCTRRILFHRRGSPVSHFRMAIVNIRSRCRFGLVSEQFPFCFADHYPSELVQMVDGVCLVWAWTHTCQRHICGKRFVNVGFDCYCLMGSAHFTSL